MELDLTDREQLTPFELTFLVTGCQSLWAVDRYAPVTIRAHRLLLAQLDLLTRWGPRHEVDPGIGGYVKVDGILTFVEVP